MLSLRWPWRKEELVYPSLSLFTHLQVQSPEYWAILNKKQRKVSIPWWGILPHEVPLEDRSSQCPLWVSSSTQYSVSILPDPRKLQDSSWKTRFWYFVKDLPGHPCITYPNRWCLIYPGAQTETWEYSRCLPLLITLISSATGFCWFYLLKPSLIHYSLSAVSLTSHWVKLSPVVPSLLWMTFMCLPFTS